MGEGPTRRRYGGSHPRPGARTRTLHPSRWTLRENPSSQPGRDLASKYKTAQNFRNWWLRISGTHRVLGRFGGNGPKSHGRIARSSQKWELPHKIFDTELASAPAPEILTFQIRSS